MMKQRIAIYVGDDYAVISNGTATDGWVFTDVDETTDRVTLPVLDPAGGGFGTMTFMRIPFMMRGQCPVFALETAEFAKRFAKASKRSIRRPDDRFSADRLSERRCLRLETNMDTREIKHIGYELRLAAVRRFRCRWFSLNASQSVVSHRFDVDHRMILGIRRGIMVGIFCWKFGVYFERPRRPGEVLSMEVETDYRVAW